MKKLILALIIGAIIIVIIFFAVKGCEPRKKTTEEETPITENTQEDTTETNNNYSTAFINASTEFTCEILKDKSILENQQTSQARLNEIYLSHGLPTDNNEEMIRILQKYENDEETLNQIRENTKNC